MNIDKAKLEELKNRYPEGIFEGEISFTDSEDAQHTVEFVFRKPTTADVESHAKAAQKTPITANMNTLQSLIVHPEPGAVIAEVREYPAAVTKFMDEAVIPFFGANVSVRKRKL